MNRQKIPTHELTGVFQPVVSLRTPHSSFWWSITLRVCERMGIWMMYFYIIVTVFFQFPCTIINSLACSLAHASPPPSPNTSPPLLHLLLSRASSPSSPTSICLFSFSCSFICSASDADQSAQPSHPLPLLHSSHFPPLVFHWRCTEYQRGGHIQGPYVWYLLALKRSYKLFWFCIINQFWGIAFPCYAS